MNKDKRLQEAVQIIKYGKILTEETNNKDLEYARKVIKDNHIKDLKKEDELKDTQNLEEAFGLKGKLRRLNRAEKNLDKTNTKLTGLIDRRDTIEDMSPAFEDGKLNKKIAKTNNKSQDQTNKVGKRASKLVDTILSNEKAWNKTFKKEKMPRSVDAEMDSRNEKAFNKINEEHDTTTFPKDISNARIEYAKGIINSINLYNKLLKQIDGKLGDETFRSMLTHHIEEDNDNLREFTDGLPEEEQTKIKDYMTKKGLEDKEDILEPEDVTDEEQGDMVGDNPEIDEKNEVLDLLDKDGDGESVAEDLDSEKYTNRGTLSDNELFGK